MDKNSKIILEIVKKEQNLRLFDILIDGIVVYGFLCRELRRRILIWNSSSRDKDIITERKKNVNKKYVIKSFFQLLNLSLKKNKIDNFIYSFFRVDKIGPNYLDKFTDPLIDNSSINSSYIIFEKSKDFEHKSPRLHSSKTVFTDYIEHRAIKYANKNKINFISKHSNELDLLWIKLDELMGEVPYSKDWIVTRLLRDKYLMLFYQHFFTHHHIKRFIAPCRPVFLPQMYVCKDLKIPVFELQHGILLNEGISYHKYSDYHFIPDYFLSFGKLYNSERYGIEGCKVFNIGWALPKYLKNNSDNRKPSNNVLVITSNNINSIFKFLEFLSHSFADIVFHVRLHPLMRITEYSQSIMENNQNIVIQDNTQNISVVLNEYEMVLGDNSTVMSEALSYGKKVGRIRFEDIVPEYVCEKEKLVQWEVSDIDTFRSFIEADFPKENTDFNTYSSFNRKLFEDVLSCNL